MKKQLQRFSLLFLSILMSVGALSGGVSAYDDECPHSITYEEKDEWDYEEATCTEDGYRVYNIYCADCNQWIDDRRETEKAKGHGFIYEEKNEWDYEEATCTENGYIVYDTYCEDCGERLSTKKVTQKAKGHVFSKPVFKWSNNGSNCTISVECKNCYLYAYEKGCKVKKTVKKAPTYLSDGVTECVAAYKLGGRTFKNTRTIKTNKLVLSPVRLNELKSPKAETLTLKWSANKKAAGYQVQYSTNKTFGSGVKALNIKKNSTVSATINKLKKDTDYYVRVRSYVRQSGRTIYSKWSNVKTSRAGTTKKTTQKKTTKKTTKKTSNKTSSGSSDGGTVYISYNSYKIHKRSNCSGMKYYFEMSYKDAKAAGYVKCKNCYH